MTQPVDRRARRWSLFAALCATLLLVVGCDDKKKGASDEAISKMYSFTQTYMPQVTKDLIEAACKEGKLDLLYANAKNTLQYIDEFHKNFPCIETNGVSNGDDENLARFFAGDKQGAPPDILVLGSEITMRTQLADKGELLKYTPTEASKFETLAPGYVYSADHQSQGILYNTNSISESDVSAIKTWKDATLLLGSAFKGKRLGMVDPHGAGGGSYVVAYVLYKEIGPDKVKSILDYLNVTIYPGSGPAVDALASGEIDLVIGNESNGFLAADKGAPVRVWYPEPRSNSYTGIGIAARAKHPNAAKLYVEFELGTYGQALKPKLFSSAPGRSDVQDTRTGTKQTWYRAPIAAFDFDVDDMTKSYQAVVAPFPEK